MNKGIIIHILGTIIYLGCFLYVSDGITLNPAWKIINVTCLALVNFAIAGYCDINDIYNKKYKK